MPVGVAICSEKSFLNFKMGYGGFSRLRTSVCKAFNPELGCLYEQIAPHKDAVLEEKIDAVLAKIKEEDDDILDFLFAPDCETQSVSPKTCKKIFDLIKDVDYSGQGFQYDEASLHENDYELFKSFLNDCISAKSKMEIN